MTAIRLLLRLAGWPPLMAGAELLVRGSWRPALPARLSRLVIGLTVVACGMGPPELAVTLEGSFSGREDLAPGGVIGSHIFNLVLTRAAASLFTPSGLFVSAAVSDFDFPVLTAVAAACWPPFDAGAVDSRREGLGLPSHYWAYTRLLSLRAAEHGAVEG